MPPGPVTVTSTVPDPAGEVAVIDVAELTVTPVAAFPPKATVFAGGEVRPGDGDRGTTRCGPCRRGSHCSPSARGEVSRSTL